jgi:drug/metabolite transporter (DMT)-like permease
LKPKHLAELMLLSAVWGVSFLMMRVAVVTFPPVWIALLRCALGASLLWTVLLIGGYSLPPRRLAPWMLFLALLNNAVPFTFFAWGERTVPSNMAAVLNATVPIWTVRSRGHCESSHISDLRHLNRPQQRTARKWRSTPASRTPGAK